MNDRPVAFDKVLIANRGEIAVRVLRSCRRLGYRTVAVYSQADRDALHVRLADESVCIGPAAARQSYLNIDAILAAAKQCGAQAVHPGYGFLSERAEFARAVAQAGLVFVGPDAAAIEAMGDKPAAKQRMLAAGVTCVPGYHGEAQDDASLAAAALQIGLPVMIKAAAGGGGRGMRLVHEAQALGAQLQSARSEAANAFGDGRLLLEKALVDARHIEVQVFGDRHGTIVQLGERECSVQRRNQKVVEEAPSPAVSEDLRARLGDAAVAAARAVDYVGAGTVEFLLAPDGTFYFLEMNTRLQVEHAVTELVYDVDLVEWQLRIARGEALPLSQQQILARRQGWAMEVRLCAEDPARDFLPQAGPVLAWRAGQGEGLRVDHALIEGQHIGPYYDSLQAKLVAFGATREAARRKLLHLLDETVLFGVASNRDLLAAILADTAFAAGDISTNFIAGHFPPAVIRAARQPGSCHRALAALLLHSLDAQALRASAGFAASLGGWHSSPGDATALRLCHDGVETRCRLRRESDGSHAIALAGDDANSESLKLLQLGPGYAWFEAAGVRRHASFARDGTRLWLAFDGLTLCYDDLTYAPAASVDATGDGRLLAPMDGRIAALNTHVEAVVRKGDTVAILEAMKMEFPIVAGSDGVVRQVACALGQQVRARQLLVAIQPQ